MSCDSNRAKLFAVLAPALAALVGSKAAGEALLDTLYDVVVSQPAPDGRAEQLAAAAATQKLKARALKDGIDLYPHTSATGLPAPEAQAAWREVGNLLDAVEQHKPLPALAADIQQVVAFQHATARPVEAWSIPLSVATRLRLRQLWAADPERVKLLIQSPELLAAAEHRAYFAEMTRLVAADPKAPPHLAAAARHATTLDEQGELDGEARIRWIQALGAVACVGVGPLTHPHCARCGSRHLGKQGCASEDVAYLGDVAAAVTRLLADPDYINTDVDASPYTTMNRLLDPWMRTRTPPVLEGGLADLLAVAQARDAAMVERLAAAGAEGAWPMFLASTITDITARRPVLFDGQPHVWEQTALIPLERWLKLQKEHEGEGKLHPQAIQARATTNLSPSSLILALAGRPMPSDALSFSAQDAVRRYGLTKTRMNQIPRHALVVFRECGCVFRYQQIAVPYTAGKLRREAAPRSCGRHWDTISVHTHDEREVDMIDPSKPLFAPPTWEAPDSPKEAPRVV